jgi:hypothetical protein
MYCSNCGNQIEKGTKFCANCGTKVGKSVVEPVVQETKNTDDNKTTDLHLLKASLRKRKQLQPKLKWAMLALVVGVAILYTLGVMLDRHSQSLYQTPSSEAKYFYIPGHILLASFFVTLFYSLYNRRKLKKGLAVLGASKKQSKLTDEKKAKLTGLDGWLTWFMLGLVISCGYSIYNAFSYRQLLSTQGLDSYKGTVTFIVIGFVVLAIMQALSFYLILKKRVVGRLLVILTLVLGIIIYGTISALLNSVYSKINKSVPMDVTNDISRDITLSVIWILYFFFSRRVKLTLTEK